MAEGAGEDESADQAFRVFAVNTYLKAVAGCIGYSADSRHSISLSLSLSP